VLADIYGWFIEGFDTADLRDAKMLLEGPAADEPTGASSGPLLGGEREASL
jgi:hypothetical protein